MIIECTACQSRYRIREEKLPPGGGNIKCPNCAHVFFVSIPAGGAESSPGDVASISTVGPAPSPNATLMMGTAPPVADGPRATGANATVQKWKIKNSVGLVYDFSDTDSLRRWLQARDSLDGLTASSDGGANWGALDGFEGLRDVRAASRKTALAMSAITGGVDPRSPVSNEPSGPPPNPDALREQAQARLSQARQKRSTDSAKLGRNDVAAATAGARAESGAAKKQSAGKSGTMLRKDQDESSAGKTGLAAFALVASLGVLVWGLNSAGIISLGGSDDSTSMPAADAPPAISPLQLGAPVDGEAPTAVRQPTTDRERAAQALGQAALALQQDNVQSAIGALERAAYLDPENREIACQLALVYLRDNRPAEAAQARARCEEEPAAPVDPVRRALRLGTRPTAPIPTPCRRRIPTPFRAVTPAWALRRLRASAPLTERAADADRVSGLRRDL
jgi:predicted Zn finger-like uncharacterized protein